MMELLLPFLTGGGITAIVLELLRRRGQLAKAGKTEAEADQVRAQTDVITLQTVQELWVALANLQTQMSDLLKENMTLQYKVMVLERDKADMQEQIRIMVVKIADCEALSRGL